MTNPIRPVSPVFPPFNEEQSSFGSSKKRKPLPIGGSINFNQMLVDEINRRINPQQEPDPEDFIRELELMSQRIR